MSGQGKMKSNRKYKWRISLIGSTAKRLCFSSQEFRGTVDGALAHADEMESDVDWLVTKIVISRKSPKDPDGKSAGATAAAPVQAVRFNINDYVRVKLTGRGKAIHRARHDHLAIRFPEAKLAYCPPVEDAEGWSKWQLWDLMQTFGAEIYMGSNPPFETIIEFQVDQHLNAEQAKKGGAS